MSWLLWKWARDRERELHEEIEADFTFEVQERMDAGASREEAESAAALIWECNESKRSGP